MLLEETYVKFVEINDDFFECVPGECAVVRHQDCLFGHCNFLDNPSSMKPKSMKERGDKLPIELGGQILDHTGYIAAVVLLERLHGAVDGGRISG